MMNDVFRENLLAGIPMGRAARSIHATMLVIDSGQTNLGSLPFGAMLRQSLR